MSGLCMAARLRDVGHEDFVILEKAAELGGTWRDNTYPGCACDIPSHLYSFSFEPNPDWSAMFATQAEILAYMRRMSERRRLAEKMHLGREITSMVWNADAGRWDLQTRDGERWAARVVVSALGALHHPSLPHVPGFERFRGEHFHSAAWKHGYDLAGRRIAVIGTGASAIQFVPSIVDRVEHLHLFQRTPPWILPKANPSFPARLQWRFRHLPGYRRWLRGRLFLAHEERVGGFIGNPVRQARIETLARRHLEKQVADPVLRAKLTPDYTIGCKRLLISSDWYPALQRRNVEVVSGPIREITETGVVAGDGVERPVDSLIFGTGFDTQNNLSRLDVRGRDGITLTEHWHSGARAFLGTLVSGFPNLFVMLGPNTGLAHNSQIFMIEAQTRLVLSCLRGGRRVVEIRSEAEACFQRELADRLAKTVWQTGGCRNWYQDGSGRNTISWPGPSLEYWWRTQRMRKEDLV
jgi:cation diffusion facilitator CzcD-associated flavoprotein CzcO